MVKKKNLLRYICCGRGQRLIKNNGLYKQSCSSVFIAVCGSEIGFTTTHGISVLGGYHDAAGGRAITSERFCVRSWEKIHVTAGYEGQEEHCEVVFHRNFLFKI